MKFENSLSALSECWVGVMLSSLFSLNNIDFYWHTLDVPAKGISYTGITLIPPTSIQAFIDVIKDVAELNELKVLLKKALVGNKWVIHFGI